MLALAELHEVLIMTILKIFEKVNLVTPIEQRRFFNYFADSVDEIESMYSGHVFKKDVEYTPPTALTDENAVLDLYHNAIVDNILFLAGQGDTYKNEFLRKAKAAFLKYWDDDVRKMKIKKPIW